MVSQTEPATGSPPRVREKLAITAKHSGNCRITPACAGKTLVYQGSYRLLWDHPRVCGKNGFELMYKHNKPGSPPRVREKLYLSIFLLAKARITPACAGKTLTLVSNQLFFRDHPRVCGKNFCSYQVVCFREGSPPRVREKLINIF